MSVVLILLLDCFLLFIIVVPDDVDLAHHFSSDVFSSTIQFYVAVLFVIQSF